MEYRNPPPDHNVNVSHEHPLKEFAQLVIAVTTIAVFAVLTLSFFAGSIAKKIPFAYEQSLVDINFDNADTDSQHTWIKEQTKNITPLIELPTEIQLYPHYSDDNTINAFATLGGNIMMYQGLINQLESDDEVIAVLAHEAAHIKYRHPIVAAGKGVTIAVFLSFTVGASGSVAGEWLLGSAANLTLLNFSRDQEHEADRLAARVLAERFGHIKGLKKLFERFDKLEQNSLQGTIPQFLRSHPDSIARWEHVKAYALDNGWAIDGQLTPLSFPKKGK